MAVLNAVQIVESFWVDVWVASNPDAADRYVVDDFVITSAGEEIRSVASFTRPATFRNDWNVSVGGTSRWSTQLRRSNGAPGSAISVFTGRR
jgi:hypothetical protein